MKRRTFLQSLGLAGATLAGSGGRALSDSGDAAEVGTGALKATGPKTWLFWDLWHLDRMQNVELCQGEPTWRPEATYTDHVDGLASWPTVYRDEASGRWRMLYTARWKPYSLMVAESDDGVRFKPLACDDVQPEGKKLAPHHIFTLPHGSCGGVYLDPLAADGYRFKVFGHQQRDPVFERAKVDPQHRWHEIARREGVKPYLAEEMTLVSRDGLHWELRLDMNWGLPDWHPEPPIFGFYNRHLGRHMMTVRPGWGDRRVCLQSTTDFRAWSGPELLLQPDTIDPGLIELYAMPVFPYAGQYVGLVWIFHCETSEPTRGFNRFVGPLDCQLAYSYDGVRFFRGLRQPFIPVNAPGEHGSGGIEPSCLVEAEDEIRIYSCGSKEQHGKGYLARRAGMEDFEAILLHTLRTDGFMYLASGGSWASLITKPLVLFDGRLTMNAQAPHGEVLYQLTNLASEPIEGFTFDDCQALVAGDSLRSPLTWQGKPADELVGKVVRLQIKLRDARLYALRGEFHFLDAQDRAMLDDGKPIDPSMFDF
jgi:hypothetical protein